MIIVILALGEQLLINWLDRYVFRNTTVDVAGGHNGAHILRPVLHAVFL